ncbi:MAG: UPF0175 family protein [Anaerolinea sp.]|nr:UPF0175 family protein [Anaerolinea sp.]
MNGLVNRREIHRMLDSLPPEALPDLVDYLDYLRYRTARHAISDPTKEAIRLYTSGEISQGRAAELAGMNYFQFEQLLRKQGVKAVEPTISTASAAHQRELVDDILG